MSKTEKNEKRLSLRQQLRATAVTEMDRVVEEVSKGVVDILEQINAGHLEAKDIMKLCCATQTSTLRHKIIGQIADKAEADLIGIWNDQQNLDLGDK